MTNMPLGPDRTKNKITNGRQYRLKTYLISLFLILLLPALGLGATVAWQAMTAFRVAFEAKLVDTAKALALAMDREIGGYEAILQGLATTSLLDEGATEAELATFRKYARELTAPLKTWIMVSGPGPDFRTQLHTLDPELSSAIDGLRLPAIDAPRPRVFSTGKTAIGGVARGRSAQPVSFIFVPVIREGRVIRAIGIALDPGNLARLLQDRVLSGHAIATIVDSRGNIAARSRSHDQYVGQPAPSWFLADIAQQRSTFLKGPSLEGQEMVLGMASLSAAPGWTIVVAEPWAAYAASWRQPLAALSIGGIVIVGLGGLLALWLTHRLTQAMAALAQDAKALSTIGEGATPLLPPALHSMVVEFDDLRSNLASAGTELQARSLAKREAERRRAFLMREVDHRAKNVLAVVLSLIRLAPRDVEPARFATQLEGRIAAMARAHSILASESWNGADFHAVATGELAPYAEQVELTGPVVQLTAEAAQPLSMLLHELATNAAKYGALSTSAGQIVVTWKLDLTSSGLELNWIEIGGPPVLGPPKRIFFGSRLIKQLAERQLGGQLIWDWRSDGLNLSIILPRCQAISRSSRTMSNALNDG